MKNRKLRTERGFIFADSQSAFEEDYGHDTGLFYVSFSTSFRSLRTSSMSLHGPFIEIR